MSRLQDYLRTPNPKSHEFFLLKQEQQEHYDNIFEQHQPNISRNLEILAGESSHRIEEAYASLMQTPKTPLPRNPTSKPIMTRLLFQQNSSQVVQTPQKIKPDIQILLTTAQKKYDLRPNGQYVQSGENKESERSLRLLTSQAYQVVCKKGPITYKLVSEEIINDTCDQLSAKQQNNIKRRVYDALNVLIALGKLQKRGRRILMSKDFEMERQQKQKVQNLKSLIYGKQNSLLQKQNQKKNELKKLLVLKKLIKRNAIHQQSNQNQHKISMPFILAKLQNPPTHSTLKIQLTGDIRLAMQGTQNFYGDLDSLGFAKFWKKE